MKLLQGRDGLWPGNTVRRAGIEASVVEPLLHLTDLVPQYLEMLRRKRHAQLSRCVKILARLPHVPLHTPDNATIVVRLDQFRVQLDGFVEIHHRLLWVAKRVIHNASMIVGDGILRIDLDGSVEIVQRVLRGPQLGVGNPPVAERRRVAWRSLDGSGERSHGF